MGAQYGIEALERALQLLNVFDGQDDAYELRDLARRTGFTKPMVLRITASFERFGYLRRDAAGRYALGPSLWRLGARYRDSVSPADAIRPVLAELVERTEETAAFYVRHGDHRVCLYRHNSPRTARIHVEEGDVLPLHQGSTGLVLLAFSGAPGQVFDRIRADGCRISYGERDPEVCGIAAPVFQADRSLVGAVVLSAPLIRYQQERFDRYAPDVIEASRRLSRALGAPDGALAMEGGSA